MKIFSLFSTETFTKLAGVFVDSLMVFQLFAAPLNFLFAAQPVFAQEAVTPEVSLHFDVEEKNFDLEVSPVESVSYTLQYTTADDFTDGFFVTDKPAQNGVYTTSVNAGSASNTHRVNYVPVKGSLDLTAKLGTDKSDFAFKKDFSVAQDGTVSFAQEQNVAEEGSEELSMPSMMKSFALMSASTCLVASIGDTCYDTLPEAVAAATPGDVIELHDNVSITSQLTFDGKSSVTLEGNNRTVFAPFTKAGNLNNAGIGFTTASNITIQNLTIDGTGSTNLHGVNAWQSTAQLQDVTIKNFNTGLVYGLVVGENSQVLVHNLTTENNWRGVNVDKGTPKLTITGQSRHSDQGYSIFVEENKPSYVDDVHSQYNRSAVRFIFITLGYQYSLKSAPQAPNVTVNVVEDTMTANWNTVPAVASYNWVIKSNATELHKGNTTHNSAIQAGLSEGEYTIEVQAVMPSGLTSDWSAPASFTVALEYPVPTYHSPADGAVRDTSTVRLGWYAISSTVQNRYASKPNRFDVRYATTLEGLETAPIIDRNQYPYYDATLPDGMYYWQMRSKNTSNTRFSAWAVPRTLTIITHPDPTNSHELSLSGNVYRDNSSGCISKTTCENKEENLGAGWTVRLYEENSSTATWNLLQTKSTLANGKFTFSRIYEAGTYQVCLVVKPGWEQQLQNWSGTPYHIMTPNLSGASDEGAYCRTIAYTDEADRSNAFYFGVQDIKKPFTEIVSPTSGQLFGPGVIQPVLFRSSDNESGIKQVVANLYKVGQSGVLKPCVNTSLSPTEPQREFTCEIDTDTLADGEYYIRANARDATNAISNTVVWEFTVDATSNPPSNLIWKDLDGNVLGSHTNLNPVNSLWEAPASGSVTGYEYSYKMPGSGWSGWNDVGNVTETGANYFSTIAGVEGTWQFKLRTINATGVRSDEVLSPEIFFDRTAPEVEITAPLAASILNELTVLSAIASDSTGLSEYVFELLDASSNVVFGSSDPILVTGTEVAPSLDWDASGVLPGEYKLRFTAKDLAGNSATTEKTFTLELAPVPVTPVALTSSPAAPSGTGGTTEATPWVCSADKPATLSNLNLSAVTLTGATLNWTAPTGAFTHYALEFVQLNANGEEIGRYGVDKFGSNQTTSFQIDQLRPAASYRFELFAVNDCQPGERAIVSSTAIGGAAFAGTGGTIVTPDVGDEVVLGTSTNDELIENAQAEEADNGEIASGTMNSFLQEVLGASTENCQTTSWWWIIIPAQFALMALAAAFLKNRALTIAFMVVLAASWAGMYAVHCSPWVWMGILALATFVTQLSRPYLAEMMVPKQASKLSKRK